MAAPGGHVGAGAWREAEAEEEEGEEEPEAEGEAEAALRSVFPRDPALFADAFPVQRRYRFGGRGLRIAQHHGPRLGLAAAVWEPALSLCRFLAERPLALRGRSVLELGAGTAIVGILAACLGGDVTLTDRPEVLDQIRENVRLNFPPGGARPRVRALVWGEDEGSDLGQFQVILGSDLFYHPPSFPPLLQTLRRLCGPRSLALLAAKTRGGDEGAARRFFRRVLPPFFRVRLLRSEGGGEIEIYGATPAGEGGSGGEGGGAGDAPVFGEGLVLGGGGP